jgi:hypothetical protein
VLLSDTTPLDVWLKTNPQYSKLVPLEIARKFHSMYNFPTFKKDHEVIKIYNELKFEVPLETMLNNDPSLREI